MSGADQSMSNPQFTKEDRLTIIRAHNNDPETSCHDSKTDCRVCGQRVRDARHAQSSITVSGILDLAARQVNNEGVGSMKSLADIADQPS